MKTILVTGATGAQGGSVARFLLKENYEVKCLTRNPNSEAAKALENLGAEIVKGDLADKASILAALQGCDGVFVSCTNLRCAGIISEAEVALGKPVFSSNQTLLWHMLELAGVASDGIASDRLFCKSLGEL